MKNADFTIVVPSDTGIMREIYHALFDIATQLRGQIQEGLNDRYDLKEDKLRPRLKWVEAEMNRVSQAMCGLAQCGDGQYNQPLNS